MFTANKVCTKTLKILSKLFRSVLEHVVSFFGVASWKFHLKLYSFCCVGWTSWVKTKLSDLHVEMKVNSKILIHIRNIVEQKLDSLSSVPYTHTHTANPNESTSFYDCHLVNNKCPTTYKLNHAFISWIIIESPTHSPSLAAFAPASTVVFCCCCCSWFPLFCNWCCCGNDFPWSDANESVKRGVEKWGLSWNWMESMPNNVLYASSIGTSKMRKRQRKRGRHSEIIVE